MKDAKRIELIRKAIDEHRLNLDTIKNDFIEKYKKAKTTNLGLEEEARNSERKSYIKFYEDVVNAIEAK